MAQSPEFIKCIDYGWVALEDRKQCIKDNYQAKMAWIYVSTTTNKLITENTYFNNYNDTMYVHFIVVSNDYPMYKSLSIRIQ